MIERQWTLRWNWIILLKSQDNFILNGYELVSIRSLYILQKSYNIYKTLKI